MEISVLQNPPDFYTSNAIDQAAEKNGFRRHLGLVGAWKSFGSTTAQGRIHLAAVGSTGPVFLALDHPGVIEELDLPASDRPGPGVARFEFPTFTALWTVLPRVYRLSVSLPDAPLVEYQKLIAGKPQATEAERLVVERIGQDVFRKGLMDYWQSRCPLTGIDDSALLRASHILPWADCPTDADRLDVHNGLLLSALWDAAFDRGLVTFDDDGSPIFAEALGAAARDALRWEAPIPLKQRHRDRLKWHRAKVFKGNWKYI